MPGQQQKPRGRADLLLSLDRTIACYAKGNGMLDKLLPDLAGQQPGDPEVDRRLRRLEMVVASGRRVSDVISVWRRDTDRRHSEREGPGEKDRTPYDGRTEHRTAYDERTEHRTPSDAAGEDPTAQVPAPPPRHRSPFIQHVPVPYPGDDPNPTPSERHGCALIYAVALFSEQVESLLARACRHHPPPDPLTPAQLSSKLAEKGVNWHSVFLGLAPDGAAALEFLSVTGEGAALVVLPLQFLHFLAQRGLGQLGHRHAVRVPGQEHHRVPHLVR